MMRRTLLQLAGLLVPALAQARDAVWLRIRNDSTEPFDHMSKCPTHSCSLTSASSSHIAGRLSSGTRISGRHSSCST